MTEQTVDVVTVDVSSEEYRAEQRKWKKTNDSPLAYRCGNWGLARRSDGRWSLFMIVSMNSMREVGSVQTEHPPFLWARGEAEKWDARRASAEWTERIIGDRSPGTEGPNGGKPIPMQTQTVQEQIRQGKVSSR